MRRRTDRRPLRAAAVAISTVVALGALGPGPASAATKNATNTAPVAVDDAFTISNAATSTLRVLANDHDAEGDPLQLGVVSLPQHGSVTVADDGSALVLTADRSYSGNDSFTYSVSDGNGGVSVATVALKLVTPTASPSAGDDSASTVGDSPLTISPLANDHPLDGSLSIVSVTQGVRGKVAIGPDGKTLLYLPAPFLSGSDSFTYTVDNGLGTATARVSVTVGGVGDPAMLRADSFTTTEDTELSGDISSNDTITEQNPIAYELVSEATKARSLTLSSSGAFTYSPQPDVSGPDAFTYDVRDLATNAVFGPFTVDITITPVNDVPAVSPAYLTATTPEDTKLVLQPYDLVKVTDVDGPQQMLLATDANHGLVGWDQAAKTVSYRPDVDYHGPDTFAILFSDGIATTRVPVSVEVTSVPDPPAAVDDAYAVTSGNAVGLDLGANDSDADGDTLTYALDPARGPALGVVELATDGTGTYTSLGGGAGSDSFGVLVSDGTTTVSSTVTVAITVPGSNRAPTVGGGPGIVTDEDTPATTRLAAALGASDPDGDPLTFSLIKFGGPDHGTLVISGGTATYTPAARYSGTDSAQIQVSDGKGGTALATLPITVRAVDDPPVALPVSVTGRAGDAVPVSLAATDEDSTGLTFLLASSPTHGQVVLDPATGEATYLPEPGWSGPDTFAFRAFDGTSVSDPADVTVTVSPDALPVAGDDAVTTAEDTPLTFPAADLLADDSDPDLDPLTVTAVSAPAHGSTSLRPDGSITYVPDPDRNGPDAFTYTVSDDHGGSATGTVAVDVTAVNDAPVALGTALAVPAGSSVVVPFASLVSDVDGDAPLTVVVAQAPAHGTLALGTDGGWTYRPAAGFSGADSFVYRAVDPSGASSEPATVTVAVQASAPVDRAPVAVDDTATTTARKPVGIDVLANDTDPDGDPLAIAAVVTAPAHGTAQVGAGGTVVYTADPGFTGTDTFVYQVVDGRGGASTATVTVVVGTASGRNQPPRITTKPVQVPAGSRTITLDLLSLVSDDGLGAAGRAAAQVAPRGLRLLAAASTLRVTAVGSPAHGTVVRNADGTVTYTAAAGYAGPDAIPFTVSDGLLSTTGVARLLVGAVTGGPTDGTSGPAGRGGTSGPAGPSNPGGTHDDAAALPRTGGDPALPALLGALLLVLGAALAAAARRRDGQA